jgi:phosphoribosyl 1,2-cyclic phosphodiesterase
MSFSSDTAAVRLSVFGSSSAGNCTLLWNGRGSLLIDCGFSPGYILENLGSCGLGISDLTGVLITHTHGDHVCEAFVRRLVEARVPVYCPSEIALHLQGIYPSVTRAAHGGLLRIMADGVVELEPFLIRSFSVPHDSPGGCFGFSIQADDGGHGKKITIATDLGYPGSGLAAHFAGSDVIVIESNHDVRMLEESSRPRWLKQRIHEIGHLSNDQCAEFVVRVLDSSPQLPHSLVLAHISKQCNTEELVLGCTGEVLDRLGAATVRLVASKRHQRCEPVRV